MEQRKKTMLIIGPGYGHNTVRKLDPLKDNNIYDVTFLAFKLDNSFVKKFPYVHFVEVKSGGLGKLGYFLELAQIIWYVRYCGHIDVLLVLGTSSYLTAPLFKLTRSRTIRVFELWSVHILENKTSSPLMKMANRSVIKNADYISQNWWGIKEMFVSKYPEYADKFLMYQLYFDDIFFSSQKHTPESDFVKEFLNRIPDEQVVCFWPRSFIPSTNHKLFLDALGRIKRDKPQLVEHFKLYLWGGNVENPTSRAIINSAIADNGLDNYVEIVDHPFVPQNDIFAIEERSDFFIQIANDDILSTYIMEMICSCKPFILSNLRTFQFLNEKYGLDVELVENDLDKISRCLELILSREEAYTLDDYKRRKEKCRMVFSKSNAKPWFKSFDEVFTNRIQ